MAARTFGIRGVLRGGSWERKESKEGDEIKKDEPDEREGEFEVHRRGGAEGDDRIIREEKNGGEKVEETPEGFVEEGFHGVESSFEASL